jgi:hypothetical protein
MRRSQKLVALTAFVAGLVTCGAASAGVTFVNAYVNPNAYSEVSDGTTVTSDFETTNAFATSLPSSPLDSVASANAVNTAGSASAIEHVSATFSSAASGVFVFTGNTTAIVSPTGSYADAYNDNSYGFYTFTVDNSSTFSLTSAVSVPYNFSAGLFDNDTGNYIFFDHVDVGASRSTTLSTGNYSLLFYSELSDFTYQGGEGESSGNGTGSFSFAIASAVPEPSTWGLMLLGIGLTGGLLRLRAPNGRKLGRL